ncbi:hypothetical protein EIN_080610 [Entamoeba invadens IP1]|uniref:hypothetical protein n=1 Tax=Entamoeba invadens IP1 TaxID=370355 RepID=UPI0002C3D5DA|nr:hypothetical protein EIN_080610 [Entamoeba invadens IP1]ELP85089.1 hypothetical protein EIN_080610 [Entamoeba invadens IP1]|eukprot:XP_004184435.1 hypothetical protein EIN_080610 [Entamoeba invadens IP1]
MVFTITVVQSDVQPTIDDTLDTIAQMIRSSKKSDLYLLPECFSTGFDSELTKIAHKNNGEQVTTWMKTIAAETNSALVGSIFVEDNGKYFNRMFFVDKSGIVGKYDKVHLFKMMDIESCLTAGKEKVIVEWRGVRFLLSICFDIKFPVFLRNTKLEYDVILNASNTGDFFNHTIPLLAGGRACENMCYCVISNRVGKDKLMNTYLGNSAASNYWATQLITPSALPECLTFTINLDEKNKVIQKFPIQKDFDRFTLESPYKEVFYKKEVEE